MFARKMTVAAMLVLAQGSALAGNDPAERRNDPARAMHKGGEQRMAASTVEARHAVQHTEGSFAKVASHSDRGPGGRQEFPGERGSGKVRDGGKDRMGAPQGHDTGRGVEFAGFGRGRDDRRDDRRDDHRRDSRTTVSIQIGGSWPVVDRRPRYEAPRCDTPRYEPPRHVVYELPRYDPPRHPAPTCVSDYATKVRIDGRTVKAVLSVWRDECGRVETRVVLDTEDCLGLPRIDGIGLHLRQGDHAWCPIMTRVESCDRGRMEFIATDGPTWCRGEAVADLNIETFCETKSIRWRGVEVN